MAASGAAEDRGGDRVRAQPRRPEPGASVLTRNGEKGRAQQREEPARARIPLSIQAPNQRLRPEQGRTRTTLACYLLSPVADFTTYNNSTTSDRRPRDLLDARPPRLLSPDTGHLFLSARSPPGRGAWRSVRGVPAASVRSPRLPSGRTETREACASIRRVRQGSRPRGRSSIACCSGSSRVPWSSAACIAWCSVSLDCCPYSCPEIVLPLALSPRRGAPLGAAVPECPAKSTTARVTTIPLLLGRCSVSSRASQRAGSRRCRGGQVCSLACGSQAAPGRHFTGALNWVADVAAAATPARDGGV